MAYAGLQRWKSHARVIAAATVKIWRKQRDGGGTCISERGDVYLFFLCNGKNRSPAAKDLPSRRRSHPTRCDGLLVTKNAPQRKSPANGGPYRPVATAAKQRRKPALPNADVNPPSPQPISRIFFFSISTPHNFSRGK